MKKAFRSELRRFRRVHDFLTTNSVPATAAQLKVLDDVAKQLVATAEEQDSMNRRSRGEVARQRGLRETLRTHHMVPITRIARRVFGRAGLDVKFLLPQKRADNELLLDAARGMAQVADAHKDVFIAEGLPADFVSQLRATTAALAIAVGDRVATLNRRKTAVELAGKLVQRGRGAVYVLDAIVSPKFESRPELLATWQSVKRPIEPVGASGGGASAEPLMKVA